MAKKKYGATSRYSPLYDHPPRPTNSLFRMTTNGSANISSNNHSSPSPSPNLSSSTASVTSLRVADHRLRRRVDDDSTRELLSHSVVILSIYYGICTLIIVAILVIMKVGGYC